MNALAVSLSLLVAIASTSSAREAHEERRINHLLRAIEGLDGATFIRNGGEHSAKDAAKHLRMKLRKAGGRVKTAEDFIVGLASKSSWTGRPYRIRLANGTTTEVGDFLRSKLREFDARAK